MHLSILSYNIQVGIDTKKYTQYFTRGLQHVLPTDSRLANLDKIANIIKPFDVVALQEVDAGSIRSGFINQTEYLAKQAGFAFWHSQTNRKLGKIAQHSNGLLSRTYPSLIIDHKLPGFIPGRGAIAVQYGHGNSSLLLVIMHLALGKRSRRKQLDYIDNFVQHYQNVVVIGDMNCSFKMLLKDPAFKTTSLETVFHDHTFPSWKPRAALDHILVSKHIVVEEVKVLPHVFSDHLPLSVNISF